jgi:hypothetical protein
MTKPDPEPVGVGGSWRPSNHLYQTDTVSADWVAIVGANAQADPASGASKPPGCYAGQSSVTRPRLTEQTFCSADRQLSVDCVTRFPRNPHPERVHIAAGTAPRRIAEEKRDA